MRYQLQYSTANNTADASQTVAMPWIINATQSVVTGLSPGTTYYFWLKVRDSALNVWVSATPSTISGTTASALPATPTGFTATAGALSVALSWNTVSGATSYTVTRDTAPAGTYATTVCSGSSATTCSSTGLSAGTTYYYRVVAVNANGSSATPASASATPFSALTAVDPVTVTPGNNSITLAWTASTGGDTAVSTTYEVWRSASNTDPNTSTTGWMKVAQFVANTSWTDNSTNNPGNFPQDGTDYYYSVRASRTATSSFATPVYARPGAPSVPTGLSATASFGANTLSWTASSGMGSITYSIYRSTSVSGPFTSALATGVTSATYADTSSIASSTAYYYQVAATNSVGSSANSATYTITSAAAPVITPIAIATIASGTYAGGSPVIGYTNLNSATPTQAFSTQSIWGATWTGGSYPAMGDFNGDGVSDIVTGTLTTASRPIVRIRDGSAPTANNLMYSIYPVSNTGYTGQAVVASCDVNNDGLDDLIVGRLNGLVHVYYSPFTVDASNNATPNFTITTTGSTGFTRVACADFNADGNGDVVVTNNTNGVVEVWSGKTQTQLRTITESRVANNSNTNGLFVGAGDYNGDGYGDVWVSPAGGTNAVVYYYLSNGTTLTSDTSWQVYTSGQYAAAVNVGTADVNADGYTDAIACAHASQNYLTAFRSILSTVPFSITTYTSWTSGIYCAGGYQSSFSRAVLKPTILTINGVNNSGTVYVNSAAPAVTGTGIANNVIKLYVDGTFNSGGLKPTSAWTHTLTGTMSQGAHTITARAAFGNMFGAVSAGASIVVDTTAPTAPVVVGGKSFFNASYGVTLQTSPSPDTYFSHFRYTTDGTTPTCAAGTRLDSGTGYSITIPAATTTLRAVACDLAGNSTMTTATYTYDVTVPTAPAITSTANSGYIKASISASINQANETLDANFKDLRYTLDGTTPTCSSTNFIGTQTGSVTIPAANTTLKVIACDLAGNASTVSTQVFSFDNTAPNAPTLSSASLNSTTLPINVTATNSNLVDTTFYQLRYVAQTGSAPSAPTCSTGTSLTSGGTIAINNSNATTYLSVISCDYAGNASTAVTGTYIHDNTAPGAPVLSTGTSTFSTAFSVTVTQNPTPSEPNFKEFRYAVATSLTPPSAPTCSTGTVGSSISIPTTAPGTSIAVIACDTLGNTSSATTATYTYSNAVNVTVDGTANSVFNGIAITGCATGPKCTTTNKGTMPTNAKINTLTLQGSAYLIIPKGANLTVASIVIGTGSTLEVNDALTVSGNVNNSGTITGASFSGTWNGSAWSPAPGPGNGQLILAVNGTLTNSGTIANGGGGGAKSSTYGCGGGYGTVGGPRTGCSPGITYGASDFWQNLYLGSGGGSATSSWPGGNGGGAIKIMANNFTNSGTVSSLGNSTTNGGGGSGGTIYITGYTAGSLVFNNSGPITATGGTGGTNGGSGRIRIEPSSITASSGTIDPAVDSAFFTSAPASITTVTLANTSQQSSYVSGGVTYNFGVLAAAPDSQFDVNSVFSSKTVGTLSVTGGTYSITGNWNVGSLSVSGSILTWTGNPTFASGVSMSSGALTVNGNLTSNSGINLTGTSTLTVNGNLNVTAGATNKIQGTALTVTGRLSLPAATTVGVAGSLTTVTAGGAVINGNLTINTASIWTGQAFAGTWNGSAWSPAPGPGNGQLILAVNGTLTNSGTIRMDGAGYPGRAESMVQGGSPNGPGSALTTPNGGGGGGTTNTSNAYGGGAGYASAGATGTATGSGGTAYGNTSASVTDSVWTNLYLGSAGGAGNATTKNGGTGGGAIWIRATAVTNATGATISATGNSGNGTYGGAGSGGQGCIRRSNRLRTGVIGWHRVDWLWRDHRHIYRKPGRCDSRICLDFGDGGL
ncbi:hypothetical protein EBZ80_19075 [bacterium]|nr:hypothetical protein [bacterium]